MDVAEDKEDAAEGTDEDEDVAMGTYAGAAEAEDADVAEAEADEVGTSEDDNAEAGEGRAAAGRLALTAGVDGMVGGTQGFGWVSNDRRVTRT
jgi:hypothetical protein